MQLKQFLFFTISLMIFSQLKGQQKAVTENGDEVILYDDGTWKYLFEEEIDEPKIPTNPNKFIKSAEATFLLKSKKVNLGFWINTKTWSFSKPKDNNSVAEYEFELKGGDLYGMIISEKVEIPLELLKSIAVKNAKEVAPDIKVVKEEFRNVNGIKVLLLQMNGTLQGMKITYYGYYYSNESGTVQFLTYTSQNLFESNKTKMETFLNGIVEIK
jgi:hypothetical protein